MGYSEAHISRLEQNERMPDVATITAVFVPALHLQQEPAMFARLLALASAAHLPGAQANELPPFKGLQHFDESEADLFFGREPLTAKLVGRLRENRFLAVVVGSSGSGKSSIVRAGIISALKRGEMLADGWLPPPGSASWPVHIITPTAHPLEALAVSLTRAAESVTATATPYSVVPGGGFSIVPDRLPRVTLKKKGICERMNDGLRKASQARSKANRSRSASERF